MKVSQNRVPQYFFLATLFLFSLSTLQVILAMKIAWVTTSLYLMQSALSLINSYLVVRWIFMQNHGTLMRIFIVVLQLMNLLTSIWYYIAQLVHDEDFVWNVDYRMALSDAQSAVRYGYDKNSLDFLGQGIDYHSAPSLIAGVTSSDIGLSLSFSLFVLNPLACLVAIQLFIKALVTDPKLQISSKRASWIIALVPMIPFSNNFNIWYVKDLFSTPLLSVETMINGMAGMTLCLAAILLTLKSPKFVFPIFLAASFGLATTKPQYIPFLALCQIVLSAFSFNQEVHSQTNFFRNFIQVSLATCLGFLLSMQLYPRETQIQLYWPNFEQSLQFIKSEILLILALMTLLLLFIIHKENRSNLHRQVLLLFSIYFSIQVFSYPVQVFVDGVELVKETKQGLRLLFLLMTLYLIAQLLREIKNAAALGFVTILLISSLVVRTENLVSSLVDPSTGYENVNLETLHDIYRQIPDRDSVLITNDLTDPADDYVRFGRGSFLTAFGFNPFLLGSYADGNSRIEGSEVLFHQLSAFFSNPLDDRALDFVVNNQIDFIIVNLRCIPRWFDEVSTQQYVIHRNGDYALVQVDKLKDLILVQDEELTTVQGKGQVKRFGQADCL